MLIVVAFALLVVGLVLLLIKARKLRWVWPVAALLVGSATLFVVHARATNYEAKGRDESLADSCRFLTTELHTVAWAFRAAEEDGAAAPLNAYRLRDQYIKIRNRYHDWLRACVPDAARCLPADLNEHTVNQIERVTAVIGDGKRCP
jgi:cell division protein FtsW (lipid II flippase)